MVKRYIFTSESVTEGHPDKICDQVSDSILDEFLASDSESRVAVESLTSTGIVFVAGEVTSRRRVDIQKVVRSVIREIGYDRPEYGFDCESCSVLESIHEQSPDISLGVTPSTHREQGAGDQGLMFGYATNETAELMPLPIILAHKLSMRLSTLRKQKKLGWIRPDGKSQVSVVYEGTKPVRIDTVVISTQHAPDISLNQLREEIVGKVIKEICSDWITPNSKFLVNPTGRFVIGGPQADTGLTGRKIVVDTYGGMGRVGGGCFSGKDPTKVDRTGAYAARYVAKHVVAAGAAERCEVGLAYAIGTAHPVSIMVETFGTEQVDPAKLPKLVLDFFDL